MYFQKKIWKKKYEYVSYIWKGVYGVYWLENNDHVFLLIREKNQKNYWLEKNEA